LKKSVLFPRFLSRNISYWLIVHDILVLSHKKPNCV
jgi:hypothetical protein